MPVPPAAFRAPGHPQGAFALEQSIDELAEAQHGSARAPRPDRREPRSPGGAADHPREWHLEVAQIRADADAGPIKRGIGVAQSVWYRFVTMNSSCEVRVHKDGSVEVLSAVQDIGSGIKTVLAQIVAEEFGIPPAKVSVSRRQQLPGGP